MKNIIFTGLVLLLLIVATSAEYLEDRCVYQKEGAYITEVYSGKLVTDSSEMVFAGTGDGQVMAFPANCPRQWTPLWQYLLRGGDRGEITGIQIEDMEGDKDQDLFVCANTRSEYLFLIDDEGVFKWRDETSEGFAYDFKVYDIDKDNHPEIIYGGKSGRVTVIDGEDKKKWETDLGDPIHAIDIIESGGESEPQMIILTNQYPYVAGAYLLDTTGHILWNHTIDGGVYLASENSIDHADLDNDGKTEFVVATYAQGLIAIDNTGETLWSYPTQNPVTSVYILAGQSPKVVFGENPHIAILSQSGTLERTIELNDSIRQLYCGDIDSDGGAEIIAASATHLFAYELTGELDSKKYIGKSANTVSMHIADLEGDGISEIILATGKDDSRLDQTYRSGSLRIVEINPTQQTSSTTRATTTSSAQTTTTEKETTTTTELKETTTRTEMPTTSTRSEPTSTTPQQEENTGITIPNTVYLVLLGMGGVFMLALIVALLIILKIKKKRENEGDG